MNVWYFRVSGVWVIPNCSINPLQLEPHAPPAVEIARMFGGFGEQSETQDCEAIVNAFRAVQVPSKQV